MNRLLIGAAFAAFLLLLTYVGLAPSAGALRANLIETVKGESPESKIAAYANAVAVRDRSAALAVWELPTWGLPDGDSAKLEERRQSVTRELVAADLRPGYEIIATQWWRTCCEPGVITDPRSAGGARVDVQFEARNGRVFRYRFDVFTRGGAYWAAAMSFPPREWSLRDVYPAGHEALFWSY